MALKRKEWQVRGIPLWLLQEYLVELGGTEVEVGKLRGDGWKASLTQLADYQIGSIRVGEVRLELEALSTVFDKILPALEKKLLRAGG